MFGLTMLTFLFLPIILILAFLIPLIAIVDILRSRFNGNDGLLLALIVIFIPFGAILYFFIAPSRKI